jgi:hypothetical protein
MIKTLPLRLALSLPVAVADLVLIRWRMEFSMDFECNPVAVSPIRRHLGKMLATVCFSFGALTASLSVAGETDRVLTTAKGWVRYRLGSEWKVVEIKTKPPQAVARFAVANPASQDFAFAATITLFTFQPEWPDANAAYNKFITTEGGSKSVSGPWTVRRSGLHYLDRNYSIRTAHRDIADVHLLVSLAWFHLPHNDAQYDKRMEDSFRSLLASISGGLGKQK